MRELRKSPILTEMLDRFGEDANIYDVVQTLAVNGSSEAAEMLKYLHKAMRETGVAPTDEARKTVGDFVLRLSFVMAENGQPIEVLIDDKWAGMHSFVDTYDRYVELAG